MQKLIITMAALALLGVALAGCDKKDGAVTATTLSGRNDSATVTVLPPETERTTKDMGDRLGDAAETVGDMVSDAADAVGDGVSDAIDRAGEKLSEAGSTIREGLTDLSEAMTGDGRSSARP